MLTYFRQRYSTRIEIDAQGKTVEVPLADPMLINKLHIALSTDGRHWPPLNDNRFDSLDGGRGRQFSVGSPARLCFVVDSRGSRGVAEGISR